MRQRAQAYRSNNPHAGLAWLAIVSLLLQALLPTGLAAAAGFDRSVEATRFYCGASGVRHAPEKEKGTTARHCALCLAAMVGMAPAPKLALSSPRLAGMFAGSIAASDAVPKPLRYAAAQPRGPPVAG